ncbi:MAG: hypothetical protein ACKOVH_02100 [Actinomycetota bacterium]
MVGRSKGLVVLLVAGVLTYGAGPGAGMGAAAPPVVANAYPQAAMRDLGFCAGLTVGSARGAVPGSGLLMVNQAVSISVRGVARTAADAAAGRVGACLLSPDLGVRSTVPTVLKFAAKMSSPSTDCQLDDGDPKERPLIGKVAWSLDTDADGLTDSRILGYLRVLGTDTELSDLAWVTGMVTKGEAVGATIGGSVFFAPAFRVAKTVAVGYYDERNTWVEEIDGFGTDDAFSVYPGLGYSSVKAYVMGNCGRFGPVVGTPNVRDLALGAGIVSPLGNLSQGFHFLN